MSKKIKKYLIKRELKRILNGLKKHSGLILLILALLITLKILSNLKKKAKKKIKMAVREKVRESIDNRSHKEAEE